MNPLIREKAAGMGIYSQDMAPKLGYARVLETRINRLEEPIVKSFLNLLEIKQLNLVELIQLYCVNPQAVIPVLNDLDDIVEDAGNNISKVTSAFVVFKQIVEHAEAVNEERSDAIPRGFTYEAEV